MLPKGCIYVYCSLQIFLRYVNSRLGAPLQLLTIDLFSETVKTDNVESEKEEKKEEKSEMKKEHNKFVHANYYC
jgi:hypothetical protein